MILPEYNIKLENQHHLEIECNFPSEYPYFAGHFPKLPILAGVVQLGLVYQFVKQYWQIDLTLLPLRQVKYQKLIFANSKVNLIIDYELDKKRLSFEYKDEINTISRGIFSL